MYRLYNESLALSNEQT